VRPDLVNAIAAGLSAIAAIFAVFVSAVSVRELRRIDQRARRREVSELDQALQARLEALYPELYKVFGVPMDGVPVEYRPTIVGFFGLYADAFTAQREGLLAERDAEQFLDEFDWWLASDNGMRFWAQLRSQSWPSGFVEHVDAVARRPRAYSQLANRAPSFELAHRVPGMIAIQRDPDPAMLRTACWSLVSLRAGGHAEFPPASLDLHLSGAMDEDERRSVQLRTYSQWLESSDTAVWARWVAVLGGRVVGHVAVCEPHGYLRHLTDHLEILEDRPPLEISRLFVDPRLQGRGVGAQLLSRANSFIQEFGSTPVLAVLTESEAALRLYERTGWREGARFDGVQGMNVLMYLHDDASLAQVPAGSPSH